MDTAIGLLALIFLFAWLAAERRPLARRLIPISTLFVSAGLLMQSWLGAA